ncbi:MRG/MORF4L-binding protein isoform X2 [Narcine bancroftii]|uniref:MRG/MORF4L-binding protein isoform X2 n=1 Tax=Narcine bancroftii TaxID=1343680 RepID=UPI0038314CA9
MAEVQAVAGHAEKEREEDAVSWTPEVEVCLFHAMLGHKPVGVNRHFHMICIRDKFSQNIGRQIASKIVWEHLNVMYDMQALHESEILPFPNGERNFVLPEDIIHEVKEDSPTMRNNYFYSVHAFQHSKCFHEILHEGDLDDRASKCDIEKGRYPMGWPCLSLRGS